MIKLQHTLSTTIPQLVNRFLAGFRPVSLCANCLAPETGHGLCQGCFDDLPRNHQHCHRCALPLAFETRGPLTCGECLKQPPPFDLTIAPWRYQFPVDRMIARYKYQGQKAFARPLLAAMAEHVACCLEARPELRPELIIPTPIHHKRLRKRGFNQADEIAEAINQRTGIPWNSALVRKTRHTEAQRTLDRQQRLRNLRHAFETTGPIPERIALVDDVMTTGATTRVLAALLKAQGATQVQVWALARTPG